MTWKTKRRAVAAAVAVGLLAVGCTNSSSGKSGSGSTDTTQAGGNTVTTYQGTDFTKNQPVNAQGVTDKEIKVASVTSITSVLGGQDAELNDGIDAYFGKINSEGGIWGRQLKLTSKRDDIQVNNLNTVQAMIVQDKPYAAFIATDGFSGAKLLGKAGIPTYGWNINAEWAGPKNFFPNIAPICLEGCPLLPHILPTLVKSAGKHKVAVIGYNVPQAAGCVTGANNTMKQFGKDVDASMVYSDASAGFGNADWSPQVAQMKEKGVDFLVTCVDFNADFAIAKEMARQGIRDKVTFYHANLYNPEFVAKNKDAFQNDLVLAQITAVEQLPNIPAQTEFLDYAQAHDVKISELTMQGWIAAQQFVDGLKAAGPDFTWANLVNAWNTQKWYTGHGWVPPIDWTRQHTDPAQGDQYRSAFECGNFLKVDNGKFVPYLAKPGKPWICFDGHKLDTWQTPVNVSFEGKPFSITEVNGKAQVTEDTSG
jgi:ABC-type branched-subunit amino acid transport system substrate-binding protein